MTAAARKARRSGQSDVALRRTGRGGAAATGVGAAATGEIFCVRPAAVSNACLSAATISAQDGNRSRGSFASARRNTSSTSGGSCGFRSAAEGIGAATCAEASAVIESPAYGRVPVSSSKASTARP
jgi:hypothetical protein